MLTRITKFQRLDYMQQGFRHLGYSTKIADLLSTKSHEQIIIGLDKLINGLNKHPVFDRHIIKHTSQKMTDNNGGVYNRRGKTYLYHNIIIHLHKSGLTTSIMLVNI